MIYKLYPIIGTCGLATNFGRTSAVFLLGIRQLTRYSRIHGDITFTYINGFGSVHFFIHNKIVEYSA
jgi:hypothetical protein